MDNRFAWTSHLEFVVIFVTLLGGFYMIDAKCERAHDRIDKTYDMIYEIIRERK